jgi:RND family efflux transporter MFP subunit
MNKYILRTSLFWLCILVLAVAFFLYRPDLKKLENPTASATQPVAEGPAPTKENMAAKPNPIMEAPLAPVHLTPEGMQIIGVKTSIVERKQLSGDIRAAGTVDIDERLVSYVQVRFGGYIRKVFADATYQYVRKGEPLFTIYSPDMVATEQDYLNAIENEKHLGASTVEGVSSGAKDVAEATEMRLRQWDIAPREIAKLKETGKPIPDLSIDSPVSGYVIERNALPNTFVEHGTRLYTVADLSPVWIYAQVFQDDIGRVKPGDSVKITVDAYPGHSFSGRIESILPQVDMATRTVRVRLEVANPGVMLKPGMFVNVDLLTNLGRQLAIPASAVLQSGTRQLVFVSQASGRIDPTEVVLGPRAGDNFVILKGLKAGQQIVTSPNFLIDSESQLQAAGSSAPPPQDAASAPASAPSQSTQPIIDFTTTPIIPHKGSNAFHVKLSRQGGSAVDGAQVIVTFFTPAMPAMGMGAKNVTENLTGRGNGLYEGSGVLDSGGSWQVTITARLDGKILATKQLRVNAEGGM